MKLPGHKFPQAVHDVAHSIKKAGGRAMMVGGYVRDTLEKHFHGGDEPSKDYDMEVHGMHPDHLDKHLDSIGRVDRVGKAFGVMKLTHKKHDFDISIPRRDNKVGKGHKGFMPEPDPHMTIGEAGHRRDFTMNSVAMDPHTGHVYDPHHGIKDIKSRTLRATDPKAFAEDPLRILRGAQFAARKKMTVHPHTMKLMQNAGHELKDLPRERVGVEWKKLLMKGKHPEHGLKVLHDSGALKHLHPELHALTDHQHDPHDHTKGTSFEHTGRALSHVVHATKGLPDDSRESIHHATLMHNVGRPAGTDDHASAGSAISRSTGKSQFDLEKNVATKTHKLVGEHGAPHEIHEAHKRGENTDAHIRHLAHRLGPSKPTAHDGSSIGDLLHVAHASHVADGSGDPHHAGDFLRKRAKALGVHDGPQERLVTGKHLKADGVKGGRRMGRALDHAHQRQLDGDVTTHEEAKKAALDHLAHLEREEGPEQGKKQKVNRRKKPPLAENYSLYARVFSA